MRLKLLLVATLAITALATPTAASARTYGLGALVPRNAERHSARLAGVLTALPASYSLQQYAPVPGDQGQVNACVAWGTAYTAMGVLENMDHYQGLWDNPFNSLPGGGGSAMYVYSQICGGQDNGSRFDDAVAVETAQGDDEQSDYTQGEADWWDQPTAQETTNAANWVLAAGVDIGTDQYSIEQAISDGEPVVLGIQVTQAFENNTSGNYPDPNDYYDDDYTSLGGHAPTAVGYDSGGLIVENSWGPNWDNGGYVHISWDWLENTYQDSGEPDLYQAVAMVGMSHVAPAPMPPITTVSGADTSWHRSPITLTFTATDPGGPGVNYTDYSVDGGSWTPGTWVVITAPANHANDGTHTIRYNSTDYDGSVGPLQICQVKIDTRGAVCAAKNATVKHGKVCRLYFKVHDALSSKVTNMLTITTKSGVVKKRWSWGYGQNFNGWWWMPYTCRLARGTYYIRVYGKDLAGNAQSVVGKAILRVT
jgi:C1A family cysteine protease